MLLIVGLAAAQAKVAALGSADCPRVRTEYLDAGVPLLDANASQEDFKLRFARQGVARLLFESTSVLTEAMSVLDRFMETRSLYRFVVSEEDNVTANPTNDTNGVSPLRRRFFNHSQLAPADDTVQGPHQEGSSVTRGGRRVIAFVCEEPAAKDGGTALFDMQRAWELLPEDLQRLLANASFGFPQKDGRLSKIPAVVLHPVTGAPCLQFYCFGRPRHACVDIYRKRTGRYHVRPDPYHYDIDPEKDTMLITPDGVRRPFIGLELYRMLDSIYQTMIPHTWSKGEAMLVDNVRWAHARLDGSGPDRKVHFFYYGNHSIQWNLLLFKRPKAEGGACTWPRQRSALATPS